MATFACVSVCLCIHTLVSLREEARGWPCVPFLTALHFINWSKISLEPRPLWFVYLDSLLQGFHLYLQYAGITNGPSTTLYSKCLYPLTQCLVSFLNILYYWEYLLPRNQGVEVWFLRSSQPSSFLYKDRRMITNLKHSNNSWRDSSTGKAPEQWDSQHIGQTEHSCFNSSSKHTPSSDFLRQLHSQGTYIQTHTCIKSKKR